MKQKTILVFFFILVLFLFRGTPVLAADAGALKVIATYSILGDVVREVGGDKIALTVLVGPDSDTHTFEPAPQDVVDLAQADIIFENGLGFEPWLDKLYGSSGSKAKRVVATQDIQALYSSTHEADPHVWQDVHNAMAMTKTVGAALSEADPAHQAFFLQNTAAYSKRLEALDQWVVSRVSRVPETRRKLVTSHDTFDYFARRYGFKMIGASIESFTTEASDPSAAQMRELIGQIKSSGVSVVFTENIHNPRLMQAISGETGVKIASGLYTDALGRPGSPADTYEKMMRFNVETIAGWLEK